MKKDDFYATPTLGRTKPKRHFFHSLIKKYRHRTDTGLVEDRTSSVTIVRIIVGLLMLHLIIIGGVLLRGHMMKGSAVNTTPVSVVSKKAPTAPAASTSTVDQVLTPPPVLAPTAPPQQITKAPAAAANHITQPAEMADEEAAEEVQDDAVEIAPAATAAPVYHMVATGDTWQNIAAQYAVSPASLQAANPGVTDPQPRVGMNLVVPTGLAGARPTASAPARPVNDSSSSPSSTGKVHVVQRGETLSRISRKVKVPMKELMQINGIKDANRISPGMKLRLSR